MKRLIATAAGSGELADTIDRPHHELVDYLAGFLPAVSLAS